MPLVSKTPSTFEAARPLLDQQSKIIAILARNAQGSRRKPQSPRSITSQAASLGAVITWNAPVKQKGVVGFRIYKDNESNLLEEVRDPNRRQYRVTLPANAKTTIFISTITGQGVESPKIPIIVTSTNDQFNGGTNGSQPSPPPNWNNEPSGGQVGRRYTF